VIAERFHLLWTPEVERHYNIAPSQTIPVVRETGQGARAAQMEPDPVVGRSRAHQLPRREPVSVPAIRTMLFDFGGVRCGDAMPQRGARPARPWGISVPLKPTQAPSFRKRMLYHSRATRCILCHAVTARAHLPRSGH
jgi:hypothetical protein